ncbi:MAG: 50S ribosomal protein L10 [Cyanobacteria bacterium HKST-UBA06]|nr:50S ribosomal protein L10 [Cyanobacteria bacterium HKST-UBA05]MCA9798940.1 50S ribosomal protein L10 [Cyanobacteria bacterium HKST-UBA04]MCA9807664.1 50S ribosomal protein L10 [Cyanobacteria bacterium HKST-UBA06]MCA9842348.1 50S ribosomal protein L10 [Cyanobacteria bacterium HKST-UBA03]
MVSFQQKKDKYESYVASLKDAKAGVVFDYQGLTVAQFNDLRSQLFAQGARISVVKNTVFKRALAEAQRQELEQLFSGPKAVLFAFEDEVTPVKALKEFLQKAKLGKLNGGYVDKQFLDEAAVKQFSELPSLEELRGKLLGAINSPLSGIVMAINSPARGLVTCLDQIAEQKKAQEGA